MRLAVALMFLGIVFAHSVNAATGSVSYGYDALGRVVTGLYDSGVCIVYAYDANGNRTSQTISASTATVWPLWGSAVWNSFSWTSAPESAIWGSGIWGCFKWSP
jgi:hypothetical protein